MIGKRILHYPPLGAAPAAGLGSDLTADKILEKLGKGGMGVVYLAEDTK